MAERWPGLAFVAGPGHRDLMAKGQAEQAGELERFYDQVFSSAWPPSRSYADELYMWARNQNYDVSKDNPDAQAFISRPTKLLDATFDECLSVVRRLAQITPKKLSDLDPIANVAQRMARILRGQEQ